MLETIHGDFFRQLRESGGYPNCKTLIEQAVRNHEREPARYKQWLTDNGLEE
eukprot:NODE_4935_length_329_cov_514.871429_g4324_i0.p2 GENE.NODE_4935_length_329_cov_514.871429_g4324_i0~~NODE_4935_length_329_cov_514.871429_g4324_i0.p2  ORF type:complete len:52 (-),score=6.13 NODE_4935_length_329_cov_514.871429_g4324_i0:94-249(-)